MRAERCSRVSAEEDGAADTRASYFTDARWRQTIGRRLATNLAGDLCAGLGETESALGLLSSLRGIPMAATAATLRLEREWDSLREEPRFQKLL